MRITVDLTDAQLARLEAVAKRDGITRAEAVRMAVDAAYGGVAADSPGAARETAFGLWKGRNVDALEYVDRLRDEWEEAP